MQIEPWQIPVLAMAALALPPSLHWLITWLRSKSPGSSGDPEPAGPEPAGRRTARRERLRTTILAILTVVLIIIFILALGPAAASILTSVASAVSALVSAVMTVQSYLTLAEIQRSVRGDDPGPAIEPSSD